VPRKKNAGTSRARATARKCSGKGCDQPAHAKAQTSVPKDGDKHAVRAGQPVCVQAYNRSRLVIS
jgi:hypothetical protein